MQADKSQERVPLEDAAFSADTYREVLEMVRIGNRAVQAVQAENRRRGIPNAYAHNGRLYFELPDDTITEDDPFSTPHPAFE